MIVESDTWIDKSSWPRGPWRGEPDRVEWRDETTGLVCLALRHARHGHWCGYVAVPLGHPWYGRGYDGGLGVEVHGGLTFAAPYMEDDRPQRERVCHVPRPGESDDVWWLGFDCGHSWDLSPGMRAMLGTLGIMESPVSERYRDLVYVEGECRSMAGQIHEAGTS